MHELGIVIEIAKRVIEVAKRERVTNVERIVLQVGELSSAIPGYLRECYPAAVDGTILEGAELVIETLPGNALCASCGKVHRYLENTSGCPACGCAEREIISGKELMIKEIVAG